MNTPNTEVKPKLDLKSTVTFTSATHTETNLDISAAIHVAGYYLSMRQPFSIYSPEQDKMLFVFEGKVDAEGKNIFTGNKQIAERLLKSQELVVDFVVMLNKAGVQQTRL